MTAFFYDENDNRMDWGEISDETIAELRDALPKDSQGFVDKMETDRIGKCLVCGVTVKKGFKQMMENPNYIEGETARLIGTGNAVCHEHTYTGTDQGDQFKLYRDKKEQREIRNEKAREKAQAHVDRCKKIEAQGFKVCDRCGGYGIISSYKHVNGGVCFECGGNGYTS